MKIKFPQIKNLGKNKVIYNFSVALAKHPVFTSLILFFIAAFLSFLVFYKYNILSQKIEIEVPSPKLIFKEELYNKILKTWEEQGKKFKEADNKEYKNPFEISKPSEQKPENP